MSIDDDFSQFIKRPAGSESGLSARFEELEQEVNRLREALKRNRAEHLSYKRRMEEAETHRVAQAAARLASNLLPVLDDLDRAAGAGPATVHVSVGSAQERVWKEGMELIRDKLMSILEKRAFARSRQWVNPSTRSCTRPSPPTPPTPYRRTPLSPYSSTDIHSTVRSSDPPKLQ